MVNRAAMCQISTQESISSAKRGGKSQAKREAEREGRGRVEKGVLFSLNINSQR